MPITKESPELLYKEIDRLRERIAELEHAALGHAALRDEVHAHRLRSENFSNSSATWYWETDSDLRFTYMSPNVTKLTGVPAEWHYGKTRSEIGIPDSVPVDTWAEHLELMRLHEPFSDFVFQRSGPNGVEWLRSNGVPVFDDYGEFQGYHGTGSVVTEQVENRKQVDTLLAAIEQLEETFVLWGSDDRLVVCNAKFRHVNQAVIETTQVGTSFEEHLRAALAKNLYPGAKGREAEWLMERQRMHGNPGGSFEVERQDNTWLLVNEQRFADGATATIATDITELKKSERAIREKAALLETTMKTMPDGLQVLDRDLNLVAWNDQLFTMLDLDKEAIVGAENPGRAFRYMLADRGVYGVGDRDELVAAREALVRLGGETQFERQLENGNWIECRGLPVEGDEGWIAVFRDITERRRLEHMKNEFVATVSHELRTPLTSIFGSLGLVQSGASGPLPKNAQELLDIAHKNCERLVNLVNDILDVEQFEAGKMQFNMAPVSVRELIRDAMESNAAYGERYGVTFRITGNVPDRTIIGDYQRLLQVMANLLSNASKYSHRDGSVAISASHANGVMTIAVRDWGPGIPLEYHNLIFGKFSRVDSTDTRSVPGTGLGLNICQAIIEQHGGKIGFNSKPGDGSTFYFKLQCDADD